MGGGHTDLAAALGIVNWRGRAQQRISATNSSERDYLALTEQSHAAERPYLAWI